MPMSAIESRLDRLEARDAAREILLHALLTHSINEAPNGHALLDDLRKGLDGILASPQWQVGHSDHAQAAVRQEITEAFGRAANALTLKAGAQATLTRLDLSRRAQTEEGEAEARALIEMRERHRNAFPRGDSADAIQDSRQ